MRTVISIVITIICILIILACSVPVSAASPACDISFTEYPNENGFASHNEILSPLRSCHVLVMDVNGIAHEYTQDTGVNEPYIVHWLGGAAVSVLYNPLYDPKPAAIDYVIFTFRDSTTPEPTHTPTPTPPVIIGEPVFTSYNYLPLVIK